MSVVKNIATQLIEVSLQRAFPHPPVLRLRQTARQHQRPLTGFNQSIRRGDVILNRRHITAAGSATIAHADFPFRAGQVQGIAAEHIAIAGELDALRFHRAIRVGHRYRAGIASEDGKTGVGNHGAGDGAGGIGPDVICRRPGAIAAALGGAAGQAVGVPEIQRHVASIEQIDLPGARQVLQGKRRVRVGQLQAAVGFGKGAGVVEQAIQARAEAASIVQGQRRAIDGQIAVDGNTVAGARRHEITTGRTKLEIQQAALLQGQVAVNGQRPDTLTRSQSTARQHRGIAQRTTAAQQAAVVHGKGHTIHATVHQHATGIHRGSAGHGVISRENIIAGTVLDQVAGAGDHAVVEVVIAAIDFQGAGSASKKHIPHDGACAAARAKS